MKDRQGIALIVSLIILAVVVLIGLGSLSLTQFNLKVSENVRSNAFARAHAETGLDSAILTVQAYHDEHNSPPADRETFVGSWTATGNYDLLADDDATAVDDGYSATASQVRIVIAGVSHPGNDNTALHVAEALLLRDLKVNPAYEKGLVSEDKVIVTANASVFLRAGVHGNNGLDLGGDFQIVCDLGTGLCANPNNGEIIAQCDTTTGDCTDPVDGTAMGTMDLSTGVLNATLACEDLPVSVSEGYGDFRLKNYSCSGDDYVADPVEVDPHYDARRNQALGFDPADTTIDTDGNGLIDNDEIGNFDAVVDSSDYPGIPRCSAGAYTSLPLPEPIPDGATVCVTGDVTLSAAHLGADGALDGVTIITDGNIAVTATAALTDTTLISTAAGVSLAETTAAGVKIFSETSLDLSSNSYTWTGENTIASAGDILFNGANSDDNVVIPDLGADGEPIVGLAVIAEGDITFNGSNTATATEYYAVFVSGGAFTQNGKTVLYGSVSAREELRFNGDFTIDSSVDIENPTLANEPFLAAVSRR